MGAAFPIRGQMNWQQSAKQRLAVALVISLVLHALTYAGWQAAPAMSAFFKNIFETVAPKSWIALPPEKADPPPQREVPMVFVEVDPAHATPEPPKETRNQETKNYSSINSIAANPQPKRGEIPKLEGTQPHVVTTVEPPKPAPIPLQPEPPKPKPIEQNEVVPKPPEKVQPPEEKPKPNPPPGDLASAKPLPKPLEPSTAGEGKKSLPKPREKPRTLQEARARNPALAVEQMKQEGGVERHAQVAMIDSRGSVFGEYDTLFVNVVRSRWYQLLEQNKYMLDRRGKVVLTFRIYQDGRISEPTVVENTVGDMLSLLCQKAILDPAPFPKWPAEMRRQVKVQSNAESREVRFTFYYD